MPLTVLLALRVVNAPARGVVEPMITSLIWFPPPDTVPDRVTAPSVLLVSVSVVARPTRVSVDVGSVRTPVLTMVEKIGAVSVLLVNVSVVARPTRVSVDVGSVRTPVLTIVEKIGAVSVLLVSVCVAVVPTRVVDASGMV